MKYFSLGKWQVVAALLPALVLAIAVTSGLLNLDTAVSLAIAPLVTGALIGGAASLLGGYMSNRSARRNQDQSDAMQREFAQHGVRWKVQDAKAAGVHPLFALGSGGTQGYIPSPVTPDPMGQALADAGQGIGNAIARQETPNQRVEREQALRLAGSQTRMYDAQALYWQSEAMRNAQAMRASAPQPQEGPEIYPIRRDDMGVQGIGNEHVTQTTPFWTPWRIGNFGGADGAMEGRPFIMEAPSSEEGAAELAQSLSVPWWTMVARHNVDKYGQEWLTEAMRRFPGLREVVQGAGGLRNWWSRITEGWSRERARPRSGLDSYPMP